RQPTPRARSARPARPTRGNACAPCTPARAPCGCTSAAPRAGKSRRRAASWCLRLVVAKQVDDAAGARREQLGAAVEDELPRVGLEVHDLGARRIEGRPMALLTVPVEAPESRQLESWIHFSGQLH